MVTINHSAHPTNLILMIIDAELIRSYLKVKRLIVVFDLGFWNLYHPKCSLKYLRAMCLGSSGGVF
jgi:hypothetical protein